MSQDFRRISVQRSASEVLPLRLLVNFQLPLAQYSIIPACDA